MIEITPEILQLARDMGLSANELVDIVNSLCPTHIDVKKVAEEFNQIWMNLPYDSSDKAKPVVVCDNRPGYGPPPASKRNRRRGRARRQRDCFPEVGRTDVPPKFPLTRVGEDRLAARIRDDANRIVSETPIE